MEEGGISVEKIEELQLQMQQLQSSIEELTYARVWEDTCRNIDWIQDLPGISPGRWAVGYNYLYVMTRILDELRPRGATYFARRDLLPYIPQILPEDFAIVIDDAQRPGEQRTIADLLGKLGAAGIEAAIGYYRGTSYCAVIVSKSLGYFCSL